MFKRIEFVQLSVILISFLFCFQQCNTGPVKPRILVFNKAEFYYHKSTPAGVEALQRYCNENGIIMDVTDESESFSDVNLRKYVAVVFLNTAGDIFNHDQEKAFENYIHAGGGFLGIHTAIDTEHGWEWYGKLIGAHFESQSEVMKATVRVEDRSQPATNFFDSTLVLKDEWFNLKDISPDIQILLTLDENSYTGGTMGNFHPVSWSQEFEGGKIFVTSMGHTNELYKEPALFRHVSEGLKYVMGENKLPDYSKMYIKENKISQPDRMGFMKTSMVCDLYEPMEMGLFPDGKIIFIERRGAIKLFDPQSGETKTAGNLNVFIKGEEGLLGLAIDPKWQENHWIYLYYSPQNDKNAIRLSRFVFWDNVLNLSSEKILLKVPTFIDPPNFHAAGYLKFDKEGFLYLSTGDNTNHMTLYAEIDERPGREDYDAQRSSSNSMDLRGKILRIKPLPDGSYLCPSGNLYVNQDIIVSYPSDEKLDDPGYLKSIKGSFNPIALGKYNPANRFNGNSGNSKNNNNVISQTDSVFTSYGRPEIFVMGVRNPFRISYDDRRHTLFWGDVGPDAAVFDSLRGHEGYDEINAAKTAGFYGWPYMNGPNKAYRYYNYETNKAGPYFDILHPVNKSPNNTGTRYLPPAQPTLIWYLFRSSMEFPLLGNGTKCSMVGPAYYCDEYPVDSRFPDRFNGNLIIYDWMRNWMMAVTLDSLGNYVNMQPLAENLHLARPIDMVFDKNGSLWMLEYGMEWYSKNPDACLSRIDFVKSNNKSSGKTDTVFTSSPHWNFFDRNRSFYQPGDKLPYRLEYTDPETERLVSQKINIFYCEPDLKGSQIAKKYGLSGQNKNEFSQGQILIDKSDCKSCHAINKKVNGPAYMEISSRYINNSSAIVMLTQKILNGGTGNWGDRVMIPHPQFTSKEAGEIVKWILSLRDQEKDRIYKEGRYHFAIPEGSKEKDGFFVFNAVSRDRPGETIIFRPHLQQIEKADSSAGVLRTYKRTYDGVSAVMSEFKNNGLFLFRNLDLKGVKTIDFAWEAVPQQNQAGGGRIELRIDGINGPLLGTVTIPVSDVAYSGKINTLSLVVENENLLKDGLFHDVFFVIKNENAGIKPALGLDWVRFNTN